MSYLEGLKELGSSHAWALEDGGVDSIGNLTGKLGGSGSVFDGKKLSVNGKGYFEIPDHPDLSVITKKGITIAFWSAITNWLGEGGNGEYVHHWGKGTSGQFEYSGRYYKKGSTKGEAPQRQGRMSVYHFNPAGGLGAGSYYETPSMPTNERFIVQTIDMTEIRLYVDGVLRDHDDLKDYNIVPKDVNAPLRFGTRDITTGFGIGTWRRASITNRVWTPNEVAGMFSLKNEDWDSTPEPPTPQPGDEFLATGLDDIVEKYNAHIRAQF